MMQKDIVATADDQWEKPSIGVHQDPLAINDADWSYAIASGNNTSQPAIQNDSRGVRRYPTRNHRPPHKFMEQTDL